MRIDAAGQLGVGETNPTSTLDVNGSMATAARTIAGGSTLAGSDHTVVVTSTGVVTLPAAGTVDGRIIILKNSSGGAVTTNVNFNDTLGASTNVITGVVWLQSIGGTWEQIN